MVNYTCPRCGYSINIKTKYVKHLRRKTLCQNKVSNNNLNEEYIKYNITDKISLKSDIINNSSDNIHNLSTNYPQNIHSISTKNLHHIHKKSTFYPHNDSDDDDVWKCEYCDKELSSYKSLWRHYKSCKEKKKDDDEKANLLHLVDMLNLQLREQKEQINEQKKQLCKRDNQIDELIKKAGITQNIQNNIKILAYKNTDLSHLTDQDYIQCLNRSNMVIPNLIKKIHFNPKKPENHNIYISNIKNKYIMTYDGKKWNLNNQNDTIEDLIDTNEIVIEQKLEEWIENGKDYPEIMKKFNRYLEKKEKDSVINKIKEEIKLILFNNRKVIKEIDI